MLRHLVAALVVAAITPAALAAEAPRLSPPLRCVLGQDCWIVNYPDVDPGDGARDFACKARSYDKHDGTDFAVRDTKAMAQGVAVTAAAAGRVAQVRDEVEDGLWLAGRQQEVKQSRRECGNRVAIEHGGGWFTDYCHLKRGSIRVQPGQQVAAGEPIAMVGLSGMTEFPHVHISLLRFPPGERKGTPVDPFTGRDLGAGCGDGGQTAWSPPIAYRGVTIMAAGFDDHNPSREEIQADASAKSTLSAESPQLAMWVSVFGVEAGDQVRMTITQPDGKPLFDAAQAWPKAQAWIRPAATKPKPPGGWPKGTYRGSVTITRAGEPPISAQTSIDLR